MKNFPLTISLVAMAVSLSVLAGAVSLSKGSLQEIAASLSPAQEEKTAWEQLAAIEAAHAAAAVPIHLVEKPGQPARYACTTKNGWMRSAPSREDLKDDCGDGIEQGQPGYRGVVSQGRTTGGIGPMVDAAALDEWAKAYEKAKSSKNP